MGIEDAFLFTRPTKSEAVKAAKREQRLFSKRVRHTPALIYVRKMKKTEHFQGYGLFRKWLTGDE